MSRIEAITIKGYKKGKDDIEDVIKSRKDIELYAQGASIEIAISLSQYFVDKARTAKYQKFQSELIRDQNGDKIPAVRIKLNAIANQNQVEKGHKYIKYVAKQQQPKRQQHNQSRRQEESRKYSDEHKRGQARRNYNEQPKRQEQSRQTNQNSRRVQYNQKRRNKADRYE